MGVNGIGAQPHAPVGYLSHRCRYSPMMWRQAHQSLLVDVECGRCDSPITAGFDSDPR